MALPNGYTQLEYIESTGFQYINANVACGGSMGIIMDYMMTAPPSNNNRQALFGYERGNTCFYLMHAGDQTYYVRDHGINQKTLNTYISIGDRAVVDMEYSIQRTCMIYSFDGSSPSTETSLGFYTTSADHNNFFLFAYSTAQMATAPPSFPTNYSKMRLYSCKILDQGRTLQRDFIPCISPYGEVGLYDQISETFFGNLGTETFVAGPTLAPDPPSNLSWYVLNQIGYLSWDASSSEDVLGYKIYIDDVLVYTTTALSYSRSLSPGQTHHISVSAYNNDGESDYVSVTIYYVLPSAPVDLTSEVANGICNVTWSPSYSGNVSGYKVYVNNSFVLETSSLSYTFEADPGVQYTVSVTAYDVYGESEPSTVFVYYELPNPPTNLVAYFDSGVVHLSWIESTTEGVVGYFIYQNGVLIDSIDSTFALFNFPFLNDSLTEKTMQVSAQDTVEYYKAIEPRTHYTFSITAYDQYGESDPVSISIYYDTYLDIESIALIPNPVYTGESLTISASIDELYDVTIT